MDDHKFTFGKKGPLDLRDFKPPKRNWTDALDAVLGFIGMMLFLIVLFAVAMFMVNHG